MKDIDKYPVTMKSFNQMIAKAQKWSARGFNEKLSIRGSYTYYTNLYKVTIHPPVQTASK